MSQQNVPWFPDDGTREIKEAVYSRRCELEAERAQEYLKLDDDIWGNAG